MIREFLRNKSGNYALITVFALVPLMGALALGVDYAELTRHRQITLNALDAAGLATARRLAEGATDEEATTYANTFFRANLGAIDTKNVTLNVVLPSATAGGGTLRLYTTMQYDPYFLPVASWMIGKTSGSSQIDFEASSEIRLKNTLEVALVLDNSGSMAEKGKNSSKVRFDLLKDASKQLVDQLASQAQQIKQIDKPVQFSLVPFAASVNIGAGNADAAWMDTTGISPIHHENFDWATMSKSRDDKKYAEYSSASGIWYARGVNWDMTQKDKPLTRFSLYKLMQRSSGANRTVATWSGCVEARPSPYDVDDTAPTTGTPETLFVPMFAPDETDRYDSKNNRSNNDWLDDVLTTSVALDRKKYMPKYFTPTTRGAAPYASNVGPNTSCTTTAITPLTDVSKPAGLTLIKTAIDAMKATGATNVPEGMAWGWRTLSSEAPFTGGRSEIGKGNDKVVIVLTDGANTYYTPEPMATQPYPDANYSGGGNDLAGNKSLYSSLGYAAKPFNGPYSYGRIFLGTDSTINKSNSGFNNTNYSNAMNQHFTKLCENAKLGNVIVMTIALDLDSTKAADKAQMDALKTCSSDSRFRKDDDNPKIPAKLFWNSTGATLSNDFKQIGNELSNLRIIG
jgi:Flp pilus assembly protein TadG